MGRLTDDMLAVFGVKPSDRVSVPVDKTSAANPNRPSQETSLITEDSEIGETSDNTTKIEDCVSCKVIGTGACLLASGFSFYTCFRNAKLHSGLKRVGFYVQGISLGTLMLTVAGCRAFDFGPFDAKEKEKTLQERLSQDFIYFEDQFQKFSQWMSGKRNS